MIQAGDLGFDKDYTIYVWLDEWLPVMRRSENPSRYVLGRAFESGLWSLDFDDTPE